MVGLVARVSPRMRAPIILFQYYNPILRKGPDEYCRQAKEAGAAGSPPPTWATPQPWHPRLLSHPFKLVERSTSLPDGLLWPFLPKYMPWLLEKSSRGFHGSRAYK